MNEMMEAYALDAVDSAREYFQFDLDYSLESVEQVDEILERFHQALPSSLGKMLRRGPSEEQVEQQAKVWGGYLGEVIRRRWGGAWTIPSDGPMADAICLDIDGVFVSPPGKAYKRIVDGSGDGLVAYISVLGMELDGNDSP